MKYNTIIKKGNLQFILAFVFLILQSLSCTNPEEVKYYDWSVFAGTKEGLRYSSITDINKKNVSRLEMAWVYDSGDSTDKTQIQTNPIVVDGVLFGTSPKMKLFAVDAATGKEKWVFKPLFPEAQGTIRGVTFWQDDEGEKKRILYAVGPYLYAVNAVDGKNIQDFGTGGFIDLRKELDGDFDNASVAANAPGIIFNDLIILSLRVSEGHDAAPGYVRAFNVMTGKREWIFHTIPWPEEKGYDTWEDKGAYKRVGGANNWAGMALDEKRGIVYVPTGSATPDFYGGNRLGDNLFANSIIALDAASGGYKWHYQVVHHDLWDRDLPANPNLITIQKDGKSIDAIAQITKHGYIFLLDRTTGEPIFPIEEVPVPPSDVPGERASPTQPIPTLPEPFARQSFGPDDISDRTPEIQAALLEQYYKLRSGTMFIPPSLQGTFVFPGFDGGGEWGGAAVDPISQIMYVNSSEIPWWTALIKNPELEVPTSQMASIKELGESIYMRNCISCHGVELEGAGGYPSLINLNKRYNEVEVKSIIDNGRGMMPAFRRISERDKIALITFLLDLKDKEAMPVAKEKKESSRSRDSIPPYIMNGYHRFVDQDGYPGIKPPWGTLNAVNLSTGQVLWKVPVGEFEELTKQGIPPTGTQVYGGPVVTKGGIVFVASTQDDKIRAFDKDNGEVLWEAKLPAAGYATPAVYAIDGRQFVVIACGGGKLGSKPGNKYVAFALQEDKGTD